MGQGVLVFGVESEMVVFSSLDGNQWGVPLIFDKAEEAGARIIGDKLIVSAMEDVDRGIHFHDPLIGSEVVFEDHRNEEAGKVGGLPRG